MSYWGRECRIGLSQEEVWYWETKLKREEEVCYWETKLYPDLIVVSCTLKFIWRQAGLDG